MPARFRSRDSARQLGLFAAEHGITTRQAYRLRSSADPRWVSWHDMVATAGDPPGGGGDIAVADPPDPPDAREGVRGEVFRVRRECKDLASRVRQYARAGALAKEIQLSRHLDQKREMLRRLELSTAEIATASGAYLALDHVVESFSHYVTELRARIEAVPGRISDTLPPGEVGDEIRAAIDTEVRRLLADASTISIDRYLQSNAEENSPDT